MLPAQTSVAQLLLTPAALDPVALAQDHLLAEVEPVFTKADNDILLKAPTKAKVAETLDDANLHEAPGSDGITAFLYKECWDILGDPITEVAQAVHAGT